MPLVGVRGVSKVFANGVQALANVSLDVEAGEFLSVLGPSGCGKSTLLRLIAGLSQPSGGTIELSADKAELGFVFQEPTLMPWATALANVALPLKLRGVARSERAARAAEALANVGLKGFERTWPRELSGGMKMRVSIARALVTGPRLLLMDEPFAALDEITRHRLNADLLELWQRSKVTVVFVTHSVFESVFLSQRIAVMAARPGRIQSELSIAAPYPRSEVVPDVGGVRGLVPAGLGATRRGDGGMKKADMSARIIAPLVLGVLMLALWEAAVQAAASMAPRRGCPCSGSTPRNDTFFEPGLARRMVDAYNGAGGHATLQAVGPNGQEATISRPVPMAPRCGARWSRPSCGPCGDLRGSEFLRKWCAETRGKPMRAVCRKSDTYLT